MTSPIFDPAIPCEAWLTILDELNIGAFTVDMNYQIKSINYCAQSLLGLRAHEVKERDCREIFTGVPCLANCMIHGNGNSPTSAQNVAVVDESDITHLITRMATPIYDCQHRVVGCFTILQDHSPIKELVTDFTLRNKASKIFWTALISVFSQSTEVDSSLFSTHRLKKSLAITVGRYSANPATSFLKVMRYPMFACLKMLSLKVCRRAVTRDA